MREIGISHGSIFQEKTFGKVVMLDWLGFFPRLRMLAAYNAALTNYHPCNDI